MKNMKRIIVLLLALALSLSLFSCGECKAHFDENGDGICESCKEEADAQIALIKNFEPNFRIVKGEATPLEVTSAINALKSLLAEFGTDLEVLQDTDEAKGDICEILVGSVNNRGEKYIVDGHDYGADGYAIKMIDNKIIIVGGSDEALLAGFEKFVDKILGLDEDTDSLIDTSMKKSDEVEENNSEYEIDSITANGTDLKGYTIAVDTESGIYYNAALQLQEKLYDLAGYYLKIVPLSEASEKSIVMRSVAKDDSGADSFRVYSNGQTVYIECEYDNKFQDAMTIFISRKLNSASGEVQINGNYFLHDISYVTYEDFGAKGDGKTDDYKAIKAAHEFANQCGQLVKGKRGATYYINNTVSGGMAAEIVIKTNVDWNGAKIIIDDSNIKQTDQNLNSTNIFKVSPDYTSLSLSSTKNTDLFEKLKAMAVEGRLGANTTKLDIAPGYPAMLILTNSNHKVYIRFGANANDGSSQRELVLIDENGNIDPSTSLLFDYETLTSATLYRADEVSLTLKNADFTTIASRSDLSGQKKYTEYYKRGLLVARSNTLLENVNHYVEGEPTEHEQKNGVSFPAYSGFYYIQNANNVVLKNCIMTGRRYYNDGTYDFAAHTANAVTLLNCTQSNYYLPGTTTLSTHTSSITGGSHYWGVAGTNFCKNLTYDTCKLTRFDAHQGLYNGKIINSTVAMVNLIGGGDMIIENSVVEDNYFIQLRQDYGSTWKGTITIKDCTAKYNSGETYNLFYMIWSNHDFGYTCHFPNVIIDNFNTTGSYTTINLLYQVKSGSIKKNQQTLYTSDSIHVAGADIPDSTNGDGKNINPYVAPDFLIVVNSDRYIFRVVDNPFFENTKLRGFLFESQNTNEEIKYNPAVDTEYPDYVKK